jgi:hypothetical protein
LLVGFEVEEHLPEYPFRGEMLTAVIEQFAIDRTNFDACVCLFCAKLFAELLEFSFDGFRVPIFSVVKVYEPNCRLQIAHIVTLFFD